MPYISPDEIIPWLVHRKLWPNIPDRKITRFWNHMKEVKSEISEISPSGTHHPLWIWGDAANYSKDQNIIVICFGSVLDDETDSIKKCFPLVLCREDPWMNWVTIVNELCFTIICKYGKILCETHKRNWAMPHPAQEMSCGFETLRHYLSPAPCLHRRCPEKKAWGQHQIGLQVKLARDLFVLVGTP